MDKKAELNRLLKIDSFENYSEDEILDAFLKLIEYSNDLRTNAGTKKAIELSKQVDPDSVFDKISYFLNYYLELGIKEHEVNFRKIWFDKKGELRDTFIRKRNLMFRALYWVSKDLFGYYDLI